MIRNRSKKKIQMQFILSLSISTHPSLSVSIYFHYTYRFFAFFSFGFYLSSMLSRPLKYKQQQENLTLATCLLLFTICLFLFWVKLFFGRFVSGVCGPNGGSEKIARAVTQNFKLFTILEANLWNLCVYWHIFNGLKEFFFSLVAGDIYLTHTLYTLCRHYTYK